MASRRTAHVRWHAKACMRYTIAHLSSTLLPAAFVVLLSLIAGDARAQNAPSTPDDPFSKGRWRAEFLVEGALEAWNYNPSHEELFGLVQGVTYGLKDGLVMLVRQRLYYVSQRRNDSRALGITTGLRARLYRRGRTTGFVQFDLGISDGAVALPPGGTRFNYLAIGGAGVMVRLNDRLQLIGAVEVIHISNAGLAGPDRNPDIEAIGPTVGVTIAF